MTEQFYWEQDGEHWEEVDLLPPAVDVTADDVLQCMGYEGRCLVALAESVAWQIAKDNGLPGPSAGTHRLALQIAAATFSHD